MNKIIKICIIKIIINKRFSSFIADLYIISIMSTDTFISQLTKLCENGGAIHGSKRESVINAVINKYLVKGGDFKNFDKSEFEKFVIKYYIQRLKEGKNVCINYLRDIIEIIQQRMGISVFSRYDLKKYISILKKILNPCVKDNKYYTKQGKLIDLDETILNEMRQSSSTFTKDHEFNRLKKQMYENHEMLIIQNYFTMHLDNYLSSFDNSQQESTDQRIQQPIFCKKLHINFELAMIVVFISIVPRRINELLLLTCKQISTLINQGQLDVPGKFFVFIFHVHAYR
ncbi:nucleocapsid protein [Glossina pallidipes salivary gland hypertrophy virus]|uniref:Nucleocapsid protein n=2 Tax=Glossina hytrovirus (isolate Glossina pallidipes/Ethiopia/Seibersdorf/-) TaxID=379529 RepID=A0A0Y0KBC0_GHVS|nr:hypothetical protein SGHV031 [Glossina pallidipes salivary gland hypertrophy virus]ABQ08804.1 hypothetical protein SGHV031 [Glossina pallidipes salivary gland hypertrophy virus]AMB48636.1 nucleocapsid protein [Glossina pallidipes salivary gland hypertrophy virus]